ncbi:alpha/beta hydrolase family esterase [Tautonia plasticadhaerens]|uniref:Esterase PHB depolymerase n=1 Tax=Tautonia plasticadhaerens TaxID=2527974 RepID=A0A518H1P0_9BACT|nr:PHB depolymerase family esterase [Tautonia plasticadhaerens]QDV34757.1 Esterase PHB depolymerase [Tautonia plasticadhaerens]
MFTCPLLLLTHLILADGATAETAAPMATERRIEVQGLDRSYLLYAPTAAPAGPRPLVLVFHGEGGDGRRTEAYFGMNRLADEAGFLVAYPEGLAAMWDDGRELPRPPSGGVGLALSLANRLASRRPAEPAPVPDDVVFVRAVVDEVDSLHPVDRGRVFATGMSCGGMFCHRLAAEAPDLIAAVAPVAGPVALPYFDEFRLGRPVSFFTIQGDADPIVPIQGGLVYPAGLQVRGRISSLEETLAKYLSATGIEGRPEVCMLEDTARDGTTTERRAYPPGAEGPRVVVDLVHGGGHGLPGHRRSHPEWAVGKTSQDYDGSRAIWEFFASCPPRSFTPTGGVVAAAPR